MAIKGSTKSSCNTDFDFEKFFFLFWDFESLFDHISSAKIESKAIKLFGSVFIESVLKHWELELDRFEVASFIEGDQFLWVNAILYGMQI